MHTYTYIGEDEIELTGYGVVQVGDTLTVDFVINHPLFKEQIKKEKK